ncbi:hypothetical protein MMC30_008707 [Trapelia coarctata]|nr:hypothetical protein [Trapelia coarctata]
MRASPTMLPGTLIGSYKRYKNYINVFTTWLSQSTIAGGYNPSHLMPQSETSHKVVSGDVAQVAGSQQKRKASKPANATSSESKEPAGILPHRFAPATMITRELLRQIEVIAAFHKPEVQMPEQDDIKSNRNLDAPKLATNKTSNVLRRYFDKKDSMERCLYQLKALVHETQKPIASTKLLSSQPTPLELLSQLRDWLSREGQTLGINYFHLSRTCIMLLKCIRKKIHQKTGKLYPEPHENDNHRDFFVMILGILKEVPQELCKGRKQGISCSTEDSEHPTKMRVAGEVIETFLNTQKLAQLNARA